MAALQAVHRVEQQPCYLHPVPLGFGTAPFRRPVVYQNIACVAARDSVPQYPAHKEDVAGIETLGGVGDIDVH